MKKQLFIGFILFVFSVVTFAQTSNNKYEKDWELVTKYEEESLPQSAIKQVELILQKAMKDKNTQQIIKALIHRNIYKEDIDSSTNAFLIKELSELARNTNNVNEKALLHSMLAELYLSRLSSDRWNILSRTNLQDFVPEDMNEWSANIFIDKIIENLDLSVKDEQILKNSTTASYSDIITLGADREHFYPTLYDFLMMRTIDISKKLLELEYEEFDASLIGLTVDQLLLPADEFTKLDIHVGEHKKYIVFKYYQTYLKDLLQRGIAPTTIITDLDRISLILFSAYVTNDKVIEVYANLEETYRADDACVEIISDLIGAFYQIPESKERNEKMYNLLTNSISRYPNYFRIGLLKDRLASLQEPSLRVKGSDLHSPTERVTFDIFYKNTQALNSPVILKISRFENGEYKLIKKVPFEKTSAETYFEDKSVFDLGLLGVGKYCFAYSSSLEADSTNYLEDTNKFYFVVSSLASFSRNSAKGAYEIFVVDRNSGKPIKDATVTVYQDINDGEDEIKTMLKTNELGLAVFKDTVYSSNRYRYSAGEYEIAIGADAFLPRQNLNTMYYRWQENTVPVDTDDLQVSIFTDRSIYRPGQTVYYKAIVVDKNNKLVTNNKLSIKLLNANNEVVVQKELITNEFGSVAGEFILPQTGLLGQYHIDIDNQSAYFSVEEYKRPTFEITFDKIDKTFKFGEEITLRGTVKNFSGISLQNTDVNYVISREPVSFWFWRRSNPTFLENNVVKTKLDGSFEITFVPEIGDGIKHRVINNLYSFEIRAMVTDMNGETQRNTYTVVVGNVSMMIDVDVAPIIEKSSISPISISARNLQGLDIKTTGSYSLYALDTNDSIARKVLENTFETGEQSVLRSSLKNLSSGKYRLEVKAFDDRGNEITDKKDFVLFAFSDKKPPIKTNEWLVEKNTTFGKDKPAEVIFGVSDKDFYILYQLYNDSTVFERKIIKLSSENKRFVIPYKDAYGNGIYMNLVYMKDGKLFQNNVLLKKEIKETDDKLNLKLDVFRDKLLPGQTETWTLSVKQTNDNPAQAEVLASMYDVSLDKLALPNAWNLNRAYVDLGYPLPVYYNYAFSNDYSYLKYFVLDFAFEAYNLGELSFDAINWFGYPLYGNIFYARNRLAESASLDMAVAPAPMAKSAGGIAELREEAVPTVASDSFEPSRIDTGNSNVQIRRNFNETAFFYPQLRTNEKGETLVSFTVPESNTAWRFRALAHDKSLKSGQLEQSVVTRKDLMVTPNLPRFLRQGDKTSISTKISNLSDSTILGEVRVEFFDPLTNKTMDLNIANQKQSFTIDKDASASAGWIFDVPKYIELIGCRIIAQNELFSDGEQHALAVLSNRMLLTESMSVDPTKQLTAEQIANKETLTETFTFDKLYNNKSTSISNYRLTLEFASNPAWYAVQALPVLSNPNNENAVNWFASYYVNTMGLSILRQYPKVAAIIDAWKRQGGNKETLLSKLQQNEELKAVLLEETPWVLAANNETEQMQRLSTLFDLNNVKQQIDVATNKLAELQDKETGAWSWYKGMFGNRSITQYILYGYANLQLVGQVEYPQQIKEMQMYALKYVDKQIIEDFTNLKKNNKKWEDIKTIFISQLEYLYVRSFYRDIPISIEAREAERFYTSVVSKNWTSLDLYQRSLLLMLLQRNGDKTLADKIAKSIREHATIDSKKGMYWANNKSNVFMSQSAVSTHVFVMNALKETGATNEEMDMMKRWLLKQKQTQLWESTHATIDAISVLLGTGSDWFTQDANVIIKVGEQKIEPQNKDLGTGYFKETWHKSEITNDKAKVQIEYGSNEPAYGSMYWQYFEDLDKIVAHKSELNVDKQLFKEVVTATGKSLVQITENNPLAVGEKVIVRLTVRVDRDMDFVYLKDMRAACFEPEQSVSGTQWKNGLLYYQSTKDASTNFYFDMIPKGTYVLEYPVYVNRSGKYLNGITTIQCLYAPQFVSHTQGMLINVKEK